MGIYWGVTAQTRIMKSSGLLETTDSEIAGYKGSSRGNVESGWAIIREGRGR